VKVKARDAITSESDWATLEISMTKRLAIRNSVYLAFLMGTITSLETNNDGAFRFLPVNLLYMSYATDEGLMISMLDETYGGFPCCSYIDSHSFYGFVKSGFICGIWRQLL
jgi:hypothetical protein